MNDNILMGINICKNYTLILTLSILFILYIYWLIVIDFQHVVLKERESNNLCK
jgi:hypothetical protein